MRGRCFDAAQTALVRELGSLQPGDVAFVFTFDVVARSLSPGRAVVAEDGTAEGRAELEAAINALRPRGLFTNLDEGVRYGKLLLFEERTPGDRSLVMISDGLTDPDNYHQRIDLAALGQMVPREAGVGLYLISLPDDLTRLFGTEPDPTSGTVANPTLPHITGISAAFSPAGLIEALAKAHDPTPTPTNTRTPTPTVAHSPTVAPPATKTLPQLTATAERTASFDSREPMATTGFLPWAIGAVCLAGLGASIPFVRRKRDSATRNFVLEVTDADGTKQIPITLREATKIAIGARGDVALSDPDLPAVVFTLTPERGQLWLTPLDSVAINGQPVTQRTLVGVGDVITVRDTTTIRIDEGASE